MPIVEWVRSARRITVSLAVAGMTMLSPAATEPFAAIDSVFAAVLMMMPVRVDRSALRTVAKKVVGKTVNAQTVNAASRISVYAAAVTTRTALRVSAVSKMNAAKPAPKTPAVERAESAKRICVRKAAVTIRDVATMRAATTICA
jgi:hypothetical protein